MTRVSVKLLGSSIQFTKGIYPHSPWDDISIIDRYGESVVNVSSEKIEDFQTEAEYLDHITQDCYVDGLVNLFQTD